jgi:two-component system, OmpR family, phosphate regulon sensor histidine kinase PhoR
MKSDLTRSLLAAVPIPLVLIGPDERVLFTNPEAGRVVGVGAEGRHYINAFRAPGLVAAVETALRRQTRAQARHSTQGQGQDTVWRVLAVPIAVETRQGVLVSFEDITELEAAGQMRRDFVANVSHELKTPLTALMGFIETLGGAARDDASARGRFLQIMAREAERMNRLVHDLMSLNRVESDERVRPTARVDLVPLLASVDLALKPLAEEKAVTLEFPPATGPAVVAGDADQLTQVFTNLIENALKYAASGRLVTTEIAWVERDPALRTAAVQVAVIDRGDGFDPMHIPRLTERFYRIDTHRSRSEGGTGLGLAIVKHIVARHRGRLRIESTPGEGSRFTVILPAFDATLG